jgi:hypothetical protein
MKWISLLMFLFLYATAYGQPVPAINGKVQIVVLPVFNEQKLQLGNMRYTDATGDSLYVDAFRFYLSHTTIGGLNDDGITGYHLVDAETLVTHSFYLGDIAPGIYDSVQFTVGVDSLANVMGAMGGDLDPTKAMYWAWNTGYIMAKLEGRSLVCKTLHHEFQFHIGGYIAPYSAARKVTLHMPVPLVVIAGEISTVTIMADVAKWFEGNNIVKLAQTNDVVMPSLQSMAIADNYAHMFSIAISVH